MNFHPRAAYKTVATARASPSGPNPEAQVRVRSTGVGSPGVYPGRPYREINFTSFTSRPSWAGTERRVVERMSGRSGA